MILPLLLAMASVHAKQISQCARLASPGQTYLLRNDVTADGTCFSIEASNITLDLNGHTITYGAHPSGNKVPSFGVLGVDCWFEPTRGNPCGGSRKNATIKNGKIVQGPGAAAFSHAIRFGQGNEQDHFTIHDLDITISAPDSIAIYGEYLKGGSQIYKNTIHNNVTVISSRSQFRGASIKLDSEENARIPNQIHDNTLIGGAQLGIREVNPSGSKIYANDIRQDATYTNGFCIDAAGPNMQIYGNHCHPVHGRGIHLNHSGVSVHDNRVETVDSDKNPEYNGCEINGTYGIQVESDGQKPTNISIYNNDVTVHAAGCSAEAMRLTDLNEGEELDIHDNTFRAVRDMVDGTPSKQGARSFSIGSSLGDHIRIEDNHMIADSAFVFFDWDSGSRFIFTHSDFSPGPHASDLKLVQFLNGAAPSQGTVFFDSIFNGVSPTSVEFGAYCGASGYIVAATRNYLLRKKTGEPLSGMRVRAQGSDNQQVFQGSSGQAGDISVALPIYEVSNNQGKAAIRTHTRATITFDGDACAAQTVQLAEPGAKAPPLPLTCQ